MNEGPVTTCYRPSHVLHRSLKTESLHRLLPVATGLPGRPGRHYTNPQNVSTLHITLVFPQLFSRSDPSLAFSAQGSSEPASDMADHGKILIINNSAQWDAKIEEAKTTSKIVVVDFTATWCGPCRLMAPIFAELSKKFENLVFLKVDVDEVQEVTAKWEVRAMPTFLFIKDGKQLDKIVGANKDELERKCHQYDSTTVTAAA